MVYNRGEVGTRLPGESRWLAARLAPGYLLMSILIAGGIGLASAHAEQGASGNTVPLSVAMEVVEIP